jgi:hypothetical protein
MWQLHRRSTLKNSRQRSRCMIRCRSVYLEMMWIKCRFFLLEYAGNDVVSLHRGRILVTQEQRARLYGVLWSNGSVRFTFGVFLFCFVSFRFEVFHPSPVFVCKVFSTFCVLITCSRPTLFAGVKFQDLRKSEYPPIIDGSFLETVFHYFLVFYF